MYRFTPLRSAPGRAALRHTIFFSLLFAVFLILRPVADAQTTGTLSGTTYDQSGAIVAHAQVVLKNEASGITRPTVSNSAGVFSISAVPPGTYTVTVSAPGFTDWQENGIAFSQGASLNLPNIKLQIGATTNKVDVVSGADAIVPNDTSAVNTTLNNHMVTELSIQGRDAGELIKIMPGMALNNGLNQGSSFTDRVTGSNSGPVGSYSANGTQPNGALAYMLDGANLVDPGNEGTQIANINQDMTSEVKVMTSAYGAEFARGPVVFEAYSKSGGAQFHGEGYLYARNGILNSEDSFQKNQGLAKPNDSYYYPGGNIGGPVLLPFTHFNHNRDKLFFWAGYEYMKQQPAGALHEYFVPTTQMRQGNFSPAYLSSLGPQVASAYPAIAATPCAPTGSAAALPAGCSALSFPNGQIPQSSFDPNSLALLKLYPQPNIDPATHGGNNYEYLDNYPQNRYEATGKLDYNVSDTTKISGMYGHQAETDTHSFNPWWAPNEALPYPSPIIAPTTSDIVSVNGTHTFSPTLTNETIFTYARYLNPNNPEDPTKVARSTVGFNAGGIYGGTAPQIPNITSNGGLAGFYATPFNTPFNGGSFGGVKTAKALYDNVAKVAGTHTMKFGFYWDSNQNVQSGGGNQGQYDFENYGTTTTGNVVADFLLGRAASYNQGNISTVDTATYHQWSIYGQDSWKATKRLTLNYGLRADHLGQWYAPSPGAQVFDPALYNNTASAPPNTGLQWNAINPGIPLSGWQSKFYYSPRAGLAYDVFGTGKTVIRGGFAVFRYPTADLLGSVIEGPRGITSYTTTAGLTSLAQVASINAPSLNQNGTSVQAFQMGDARMPYTESYNFTVSQALPGHTVFEASYVGNQSHDQWLESSGTGAALTNLNNIPIGSFFKPDPITGVINNPASIPNIQDYRPYHNYQGLGLTTHGSYANYNSLQASFQKQTGRVTFLSNYTFSKVLGIRDGQSAAGPANGGLVDPFNIANNYGVLAYDHTHIFNFAYVFNLPSPIHGNAILKGVVNGWEISGVTQWQSGAPIQPNTGENLYAQYPSSVSSATYFGTDAVPLIPTLTCDPRSGLKSGQFFNPNCFAAPSVGSRGNFNWPYIKGPAYWDSDLALFKNFKVTEAQSLQFRFTAFNFLNHALPQFNADGTNNDLRLNFNNNNSLAPVNINTLTTGAPKYTVGNRLVELAVKYYF